MDASRRFDGPDAPPTFNTASLLTQTPLAHNTDTDWLNDLDESFDEQVTPNDPLPLDAAEQSPDMQPVTTPTVRLADNTYAPDITGAVAQTSTGPLHVHGNVQTKNLIKLDQLARMITLHGKSLAEAAQRVGWSYQRAWLAVRNSKAYAEIRARLISQYAQAAEARDAELMNVVVDTAYVGVMRQNEIVRTSQNEQLVASVADKAMDRIGLRAPDQAVHRVIHELSPASAALISKANAAKPITDAIDLDKDYGFALTRPQLDDDRARDAIGKAYGDGGSATETPKQPDESK